MAPRMALGGHFLLRSKNGVNLFTQSAENGICMGKQAFPSGTILFLRLQKNLRHSDFWGAPIATDAVAEKIE